LKCREKSHVVIRQLRGKLRQFKLHLEEQTKNGELAQRTLEVQHYRVGLGMQFLKIVLPAGQEAKISAIDGSVWNGYLDWRQKTLAAKKKTIRRDVCQEELLVIRKMFKFALERKLCTDKSIPTWNFKVEDQGATRQRMLPKDYYGVLDAMKGEWLGGAVSDTERHNRQLVFHVFMLASHSGMRSGEIFGLKNRDVDVHSNINQCLIRIRPETSKVRKGRDITVGVSTAGRENDSKVTNYLLSWIQKQRNKQPDDFVFSLLMDGKRDARNIFYQTYNEFRERLAKVGLEWFDLYHCRHWWVTNRLVSEEAIHLIAKAAGTSVSEIEKTYSHVLTAMTTRKFAEKRVQHDLEGAYEVVKKKGKKPK
jgi:integrase